MGINETQWAQSATSLTPLVWTEVVRLVCCLRGSHFRAHMNTYKVIRYHYSGLYSCPRTDLSVMLWYSELLWAWSMYKAVNNGCQTVTVTTPVRSDCCCCTWPLSFHGEGAGEKEQQQLGIRFQLPKLRRTEPSLGGEDAFCVSHHIFLT